MNAEQNIIKKQQEEIARLRKENEEEEAQAEQAFWEGKEGGVIRWKPEEEEEELNSDDDDYEDKMAGKWECRRCGEKKASSWVFDDGDCLNYCRECLDELEEDGQIEKSGDTANYQYKWGYADRMERGLEVM